MRRNPYTSVVLAALLVTVSAGAQPSSRHDIPSSKRLPRGWVMRLAERGEKEVFRGNELTYIGMPIGGICTGQLYLCGDGTLGSWEIFNHHEFRGTGGVSYTHRVPKKPVDQGIAVVVESPAGRDARVLNRASFSEVEFVGEYPIGTVRYSDPGFPVTVEMETFSPFIPLNAADSALPATVFNVTITNTSREALRAGCLSWLENAVCAHSESEVTGLRRTRIAMDEGRMMVIHEAQGPPKTEEEPERPGIVLHDFEDDVYGDWETSGEAFGTGPAHGTLPGQVEVTGFQGAGLVNTFLGGSDELQGTLVSPPFTIERKHVNFLIGGGGHANATCMNLIVGDEVARTATGHMREHLAWASWNVETLEDKEARIEIVDRSSAPWGHVNVDEIELSDVRRSGPSGPVNALADFGSMVLAMNETSDDPQDAVEILIHLSGPRNKAFAMTAEPYPFPGRQSAALLANRSEIAPGAKRTVTFVLAWHFPNALRGHEYANRFRDATAVAQYVLDNEARLSGDTRMWRDTYYDSTLPYWLLDRLHSTVSYLATGTCQWWQNGRFWCYEGVVCCEGTCTHVWNYAHAHARLFPELARSARELQDLCPRSEEGGFHPDTGLVGFRGKDACAADGQCGTVLKAYREHTMSPGNAFLERSWPKIKRALEYSIEQDANDDGLIENSQHNTYDIDYVGANTFVGSLYLAALRAGEEMAIEMGDAKFAQRARRIFDSGAELTFKRLWRGQYFAQDVDLDEHPKHQYGEGCLSDQLFGQGWAHQVGLGFLYREACVKQTLESIWRYNWAPDVGPHNEAHEPLRSFAIPGEAGLFTCTWPRSKHLDDGTLYKNEVWTGIEYQVAGNMVWDGMLEEGLAICRAIHDRYNPVKRNPYNEVECGDHYARALASWGVLIALCGYEYHGPKGRLGFAPRITPEDFRSAFTAAEGWGTFAQTRVHNVQTESIIMRRGKLRLKTLAFAIEDTVKSVKVTVGEETLEASHDVEGKRLTIAFPEEVTVNEGETLDVTITAAWIQQRRATRTGPF